jgi:hypothetical protein
VRDVALFCVIQGGFLFGFGLSDLPLITAVTTALSATAIAIGMIVFMQVEQ